TARRTRRGRGAVFCIPATVNGTVNLVVDLPGAGRRALPASRRSYRPRSYAAGGPSRRGSCAKPLDSPLVGIATRAAGKANFALRVGKVQQGPRGLCPLA